MANKLRKVLADEKAKKTKSCLYNFFEDLIEGYLQGDEFVHPRSSTSLQHNTQDKILFALVARANKPLSILQVSSI